MTCTAQARRSPAALVATMAVAVGLALVGSGASAAPADHAARADAAAPAFPPQRPTRVLILGDSVLAGAASLYGGALPGRDVTVDAVVNRTTGQGADVLARLGSDWDVVIVLLGHNDGGSPGVYQPAAGRILDQLAGVPRVVWLSLHEVRPYYVGVNQFLRDQATRRPNLRIADWNAVASAHPEGLAPDGLHLNGAGARSMAYLVAAQVTGVEGERARYLQAVAAARARATTTTTTTTVPATTTTTAPTTTTAATATTTDAGVGLIPATSIDRPTTTRAPRPAGADGDAPGREEDLGSGAVGAIAMLGIAGLLIGVTTRRSRRPSRHSPRRA